MVTAIVLGLLGFLVLLFFVPFVISLRVHGQAFALRLYVLGIRVLYLHGKSVPEFLENIKKRIPKRNPNKKKKTAQKKTKTTQKKSKQQETHDLAYYVQLLQRLSQASTVSTRFLLHFVWFYDIELFIPVQAANAALVAQNYGKTQALLGTARAALCNLVHIKFKKMVVFANFAEQPLPTEFAGKIAVSPSTLFLAGIYMLVYFLKGGPYSMQRKRKLRKLIRQRKKKQRKQAG